MQVATEDNVYILDVTTIGNKLPELWNELGLILFGNKDIVKIGMCFQLSKKMSSIMLIKCNIYVIIYLIFYIHLGNK